MGENIVDWLVNILHEKSMRNFEKSVGIFFCEWYYIITEREKETERRKKMEKYRVEFTEAENSACYTGGGI